MEGILITGATGSIGAAVVKELISMDTKDPIRLFLLMRARDERHLQERISSLYDFWGISEPFTEGRLSIEPVMGDVSLPGLGMREDVLEKVVSHTTHILHCAGNVRMNLPLEEARLISVKALGNLLEIAGKIREAGHLEKIDVVTTIGVAGRMSGIIPEKRLEEGRTFHNTYEQAKAEAEDLLFDWMDQGFPITIHRPSMVVGDSRDGRIVGFKIFYYLCEFLAGQKTGGLVPWLGEASLDIVPVDFVARAMIVSLFSEDSIGRVFHLCSGRDAIRLMSLADAFRRLLGEYSVKLPPRIVIPMPAFKLLYYFLVFTAGEKRKRALKTLPYFMKYLGKKQIFENRSTLDFLKERCIDFVPPEEYLERVLRYYLDAKYGVRQ